MLRKDKNEQIYEMEMDVSDFNKGKLKSSARAYRLIFNFCLRKMLNCLDAPSKALYEKEHESVTFNNLSYELHRSMNEKSCSYLNAIYNSVHVSVINNAILNSIGYFNKWKRRRRKSDITVSFPNEISKKDTQFFVIGNKDFPVLYSSKGLYLRRLARFKILGSYDEKKDLMGTYSKVKVFYKNSTCKWYCQFNLMDRKN